MELSEEEKKAIEYIKDIADVRSCVTGDDLYEEDALILLKLINKQQKKIEKLKDKCKELIIEKQQLTSALLDSTPNYKIREKIKNIEDIYEKEMKPYQTEYGLDVSLLSKKEKEELINKRNGLLTQKVTLEELLEEK